jgi:pimeloyl-ACP methyl ester carboxylesterase
MASDKHVNTKPVIILLHGAWHRPLHYIHLISALHEEGYTVVAPALPTSGPEAAGIRGKTITDDDVSAVKAVMAPFLEADREIVVICHSLGGLAGTDSVVGNTVPERRARGLKGGVKAMVYLCAFAPTAAGLSVLDQAGATGGEYPWWWDVNVCLAISFDPNHDYRCRSHLKAIMNYCH